MDITHSVAIMLLTGQPQKKLTVLVSFLRELCNRAWVTELQLPWT